MCRIIAPHSRTTGILPLRCRQRPFVPIRGFRSCSPSSHSFQLSSFIRPSTIGIRQSSFQGHLGVKTGSFGGHFGVVLGSLRGRFGVISGSFWGRFRVGFYRPQKHELPARPLLPPPPPPKKTNSRHAQRNIPARSPAIRASRWPIRNTATRRSRGSSS